MNRLDDARIIMDEALTSVLFPDDVAPHMPTVSTRGLVIWEQSTGFTATLTLEATPGLMLDVA